MGFNKQVEKILIDESKEGEAKIDAIKEFLSEYFLNEKNEERVLPDAGTEEPVEAVRDFLRRQAEDIGAEGGVKIGGKLIVAAEEWIEDNTDKIEEIYEAQQTREGAEGLETR